MGSQPKRNAVKPRHAAALALVQVGIVILFVGLPVGALLFTCFAPINEFGNALGLLAWLPNMLLYVLFNHWITDVDENLPWLIVVSAFPVVVWGVAGLLLARRIRTLASRT
jgi:hypothetical protein